MHQAGTVGTCYEFSTSGGMSSQFALAHLLADGKLLDAEHSAKPTTFVISFRLDHLNVAYQSEQVLYFVESRLHLLGRCRQIEFSCAMAGINAKEGKFPEIEFRHVIEILAEGL